MGAKNTVSIEMPTALGNFHLYVWEGERGRELVALSTPTLDAEREVMVRIHSECLTGDTFHSLTCDCGPQKDLALKRIQEHGNGIFIYHRQEGRNAGLFKKIESYNLMQKGMDTHEAFLSVMGHPDPREYSEVIVALNHLLGNKKPALRLLTNNPYKALFLERHGYKVVVEQLRTDKSLHSAAYTDTKTQKFLHNTIGYAPYASITLSRNDIQTCLQNIRKAVESVRPFDGGRKLFIGVGIYPAAGELTDPKLIDELQLLYAAVSRTPNTHIVLHMDYPTTRLLQRVLKNFLAKLSFQY